MENKNTNVTMKESKRKMYQTFKIDLFKEPLAFKEINGLIVIEPDKCDLRPIHERYDKQTKTLTLSCGMLSGITQLVERMSVA